MRCLRRILNVTKEILKISNDIIRAKIGVIHVLRYIQKQLTWRGYITPLPPDSTSQKTFSPRVVAKREWQSAVEMEGGNYRNLNISLCEAYH